MVLAVVVWMLYHPASGLWWTYDDAFHFHQSLSHRPSEILFSRAFWRGLPNPVFTPLLFLSFKQSLHFFGADPHQGNDGPGYWLTFAVAD